MYQGIISMGHVRPESMMESMHNRYDADIAKFLGMSRLMHEYIACVRTINTNSALSAMSGID